jgi:hypothetical protein
LATASAALAAAAGNDAPAALTAGFHAGFTVSAALVAVTVAVAAALLRDEGRGQRVNMLELQAGQ